MPRNLDYPMPMHGRMMRQRLWETQLDAGMLYDTLRDDDAVPAWTLDKVARGADGIHQVSRYLRFKVSHPIHWGAADAAPQRPPLWQIALGTATLFAALVGANGIVVLLAQAADPGPSPKKKKSRRPRRPVHFAL